MKFYTPLANRLLAGLSSDEQEHLGKHCDVVHLEYGQVLFEPGQQIEDVYFPEDCLISLLGILNMRTSLEVGLVGNEGVVGMSPNLIAPAPQDSTENAENRVVTFKVQTRAVVQKAGRAIKISSENLIVECKKNPQLQLILFNYVNRFLAQTTQIAVCSTFHMLEARLARSLLTTKDHLQSSEFHLTHEFIAHSLGVRRVGVTKAASALQRRNLIGYSRGQIKILDEAGLASVSCECYQIIKDINDIH
ncbi:CRP-like cAMP-binding protein [Undibacterium sp. GrIS 1.8]|uniref:Crp/Fnr family transcriptional regulator n=1 Tax=Undibacterium sp. GrIS 1.8 TaxID=3143934 RepID=UPI00339B5CC7